MMRDERGHPKFADDNNMQRKYGNITHSDPNLGSTSASDDEFPMRHSSASANTPASYDPNRMSGEGSPMTMSPWNQTTAFIKHEWSQREDNQPQNTLIGSLVREEGHIYSLAASGDLLYTGSDSKNIRVWKNLKEFSGFKSNSGLVKAIIISGEKIFSGHQDGKIRVWKVSPKNPNVHKRVGSLPTLKDIFKSSIKPSNYVEVRRRRSSIWIKHSDAISSLSLTNDRVYLYSASWDRTVKVWRVANSKCVESVKAHDDAVNAVICSEEGLVYTGSADGTVKVWKREQQGKGTKHGALQTLLKQECAVNALALNAEGSVLYCGSSDGLVNFWERKKQFSHGGVLKGHKLAVLCLAAAGNTMVFTGSADKNICVWRRGDLLHTCLSVLTGHNGPVKCLAVEVERDEPSSSKSDRRWIVYSGSLDKSVKVWSVSEMAAEPNHMGMTQQEQAGPVFDTDSSQSEESVSSASGSRGSQNRRY